MKTIQKKSMQIFAAITMLLFIGTSLMAGNTNPGKGDKTTITKSADNNHPTGIGCDARWAIQLCYDPNFSGPARCMPLGTHQYRAGALGYPRSVRVRTGYYAIFKKNGRIVNTTPRGIRNFRFQFDEVIVKRRRPNRTPRQPLPGSGSRRPRWSRG